MPRPHGRKQPLCLPRSSPPLASARLRVAPLRRQRPATAMLWGPSVLKGSPRRCQCAFVRWGGAVGGGRCLGAATAAVGGPCHPIWAAGARLATDWSVECCVRARGGPAADGRVGGRAGHHSWSPFLATGPRAAVATGVCVATACLLERRQPRRCGSQGAADASVGLNTGCRLRRGRAPHTAATAAASRWCSGW